MATSKIEKVTNNSGSNYCKMPDGTLIQWGVIDIHDNDMFVDIVFPISYIGNSYGFSVLGAYSYVTDVTFVYTMATTSGIRVYRGGSDTHNQPFRWIAIGHWK